MAGLSLGSANPLVVILDALLSANSSEKGLAIGMSNAELYFFDLAVPLPRESPELEPFSKNSSSSLSSPFLLWRMKKNIASAMQIKPTKPPTTPPAMAPTFVDSALWVLSGLDDALGEGEDVEPELWVTVFTAALLELASEGLEDSVEEEDEELEELEVVEDWEEDDELCRDVVMAASVDRIMSVEELNSVVEGVKTTLSEDRDSEPALAPVSWPEPLKTVYALGPPQFTSP